MIKVGDRLPDGFFRVKNDSGAAAEVTTDALFAGQKVVFVGVPGAFTSTCHNAHIPQFVAKAAAIKAKGVDRIAVMAVNDHHVMKVWEDALGATGKIDFLSDGSATYTKLLGMDVDRTKGGMGIRARRFSMIVDDGVVKAINLEPDGSTTITATGADAMLEQL
jgi:peroxiredoxin